jgi:hypothetical protein
MKRFFSSSKVRLIFEILIIIALLMAAFPDTITTKATTLEEPESPTALYWYQCNPTNHVALFTNRIHIYCASTTPISTAPSLPGIYWFAFPTSPDSAAASRFMSLMQTGVIAGRTLWVLVDPNDTSGTSFSCGASDCRRIYGMEMR